MCLIYFGRILRNALIFLSIQEDKKDESQDGAPQKKADSDADEDEQDNQQKEKGGISNKKKKVVDIVIVNVIY